MKKRILRIALIILIIILLLPLVAFVILNTSWGQSQASTYVSDIISTELGVEVKLGQIQLDPMTSLAIDDVLILDHHQDTLLWIPHAHTDIGVFELGAQKILLDEIRLGGGLFRLKRYAGEEQTNLQPILDKLSEPRDPDSEPWDFAMTALRLEDMRIEHIDAWATPLGPGRLDANQLRLSEVNLVLTEIDLSGGAFAFTSRKFSLVESSGLRVKDLTATALISESQVELKSMNLLTNGSNLQGDLRLDFSASASDSIIIETTLKESRLLVEELGYFIPDYEEISGEVEIDAQIKGTLGALLLRDAKLSFGRYSNLYLDALIKGLPKVEDLWISADIRRFESDVNDMRYLPVPKVEEVIATLPPAIQRMGSLDFIGDFEGSLKDFKAEGNLRSDLGDVEAALDVHFDAPGGGNRYTGSVVMQEVDLGTLLAIPDLGTISTHVRVDVIEHGQASEALIKGQVDHLVYKGYDYRNVKIDGRLEELLFNGQFSLRQPEADFDFTGLVDLQGSRPSFDFTADVFHIDLGAIGLMEGLDSTSVNGMIKARFTGKTIDDFAGTLGIQGLSYCQIDEEYFFQDIEVEAAPSPRGRELTLRSTPIDARIEGIYRFADLKYDFIGLFDEVLPTLMQTSPQKRIGNSDFSYEVTAKDIRQLSKLFIPELSMSAGTRIEGRLNSERSRFGMVFTADSVAYDRVELTRVNAEMERVADVAYVSIISDNMALGDSLRFKDNYYTFNAYRDTIETDFTWSMVGQKASGSISALTTFKSIDSIRTILYPSQMVLNEEYWLTQGESEFVYHHDKLSISQFELSKGDESILVVGDIGASKEDRLDYMLQNLELYHLNSFLPTTVANLSGEVQLDGYVTSVLGKPTVVADLFVEEFALEGERIGDIDIHSTWSRGEDYLLLRGGLEKGGRKAVMFDGQYFPRAEKDNFDAILSLDRFDLSLLNRLPLSAVSGFGGEASGELTVKGSGLAPDINGELDFIEAKVHVDYLNTDYKFSNKVKVRKSYIATDYIPFTDMYGNKGRLNGTVAHNNFRDWNYDIFVEFDSLLVLNTTAAMSDTFYGTVYGTGSVSLSGFDDQLSIEVYAKTEKNTVLELPLGEGGDVVLDDFIYFKRTAAEDSLLAVKDKKTTGVDLLIQAEVTPEAHLKLIFDEKIGDVMQGSGTGTLTMTLDKSGDFEMFGNYLITEGDYLFTLQNVVNKRFQVASGSTVGFYGNPLEAELDLEAIYKVRAPLSDLLPGHGEQYSQRTAVNCTMILNGQLFNPEIGFDITFPDLDPNTRTLAESKLNTDEELNRQVFSLLILNKFLGTGAATVNDGIAGVSNTGSEFLSAQLSNWASQISDDLDIGVNYRAGDNVNSEELAVALSTHLFNDRLLLSGNFGVQGTAASTAERATSIIGDFRLEYFILPDGRLRLKVFSESTDSSVLNLEQSPTKQGLDSSISASLMVSSMTSNRSKCRNKKQ